MKRFIQGEQRGQSTLLPESLDDCVSDTNPVRTVDVFVDELDLVNLGFEGAVPADTGRPAYHPEVLLLVAIDGSKSADKADGRFNNDAFIYDAAKNQYVCPAGETLIWRFSSVEKGMKLHRYWSSKCQGCALKLQCTPSTERRIRRWEHEAVLEKMQLRLSKAPDMMRIRKRTVEHPFGTLKQWMGATRFLTRKLEGVGAEMSLNVLAYNMKRVIKILGTSGLMKALSA
ncbi:hypothetical protein CQ009_11870 [Pseudomonas sp. MYb2]|jgi:hypothetical protein|uniref:transposase n=1 Tax=unclassified Pseudomonas TaxID=196821 RepID=UPI000CFE3B00|nr:MULTISPECIES: transposase [unclassified Pseudomonas]PRB50986.1 hypothetical protein CQ025_08515 [Pseudomonas sp. MYb3]PRC34365.1 hypothetical protein CQ009_11870 [Pseudomonas sp. MYb2]